MSHASQPVAPRRGADEDSVNTFRCTLPQCTQRFATITGLRQHARHTHPRAYRCRVPRCYDGFISASELAHHSREKHGTCEFVPLTKPLSPVRSPSDAVLVFASAANNSSSNNNNNNAATSVSSASTSVSASSSSSSTHAATLAPVVVVPTHHAHQSNQNANCLCPLAPLCSFAAVDFAAVRAHVEQFSLRLALPPDSPVIDVSDDESPPLVILSNNHDKHLDLPPTTTKSDPAVLTDSHGLVAEPPVANPLAAMLDCDEADIDSVLASAHAALSRCDRCVFVCVEESDLVRHRTLHDIDNHAVPCLYPGCDRSFPSRAGLRVHARAHMVSPTHACPLPGCKEGPFLKSELKEHAKKHANLLGICPAADCGRILPNQELLRAHLKHDHAVTFRCTFPMCARTYTSYVRLQRHIKESHLRYLLPKAFADMRQVRPTAAAAARPFGPFGEQFIAAPPKRAATASLSSRLTGPSRGAEASVLAPRSIRVDDDDDASVSMSGVNGNDSGTAAATTATTAAGADDVSENHLERSSQKRTANDAAEAERNATPLSASSARAAKTDATRKRARRVPASQQAPPPPPPPPPRIVVVSDVSEVIDSLPEPPPMRPISTSPSKRSGRGGGNSARRKVKALAVNESLNESASGTLGDDADASQDESLRSSQRRQRRLTTRGAAYAQELASSAGGSVETTSRLVRAKPKFSRTSPDESAEETEDAEHVLNMGRLAPRRTPRAIVRRRSVSPPTMPVEASPVIVPPDVVVLMVDDSMASASSSDESAHTVVEDEPPPERPQTPTEVIDVSDKSSSQSPEISFDVLQERMATLSRLQREAGTRLATAVNQP